MKIRVGIEISTNQQCSRTKIIKVMDLLRAEIIMESPMKSCLDNNARNAFESRNGGIFRKRRVPIFKNISKSNKTRLCVLDPCEIFRKKKKKKLLKYTRMYDSEKTINYVEFSIEIERKVRFLTVFIDFERKNKNNECKPLVQ